MKRKLNTLFIIIALIGFTAFTCSIISTTKVNGNIISEPYSINSIGKIYLEDYYLKTHIFLDTSIDEKLVETTYTLKDKPTKLEFIKGIFLGANYHVDIKYKYNENNIREYLEKRNSTRPKAENAEIYYEDNKYKIKHCKFGDQVDIDRVINDIKNKKMGIDLDNYVIEPDVRDNDLETAYATANAWLTAEIDYDCGEQIKLTHEDFSVSANGITMNNNKLTDTVKAVKKYYDEEGQLVKLHDGTQINVSGGTYTYTVAETEELDKIYKMLDAGKLVTKRVPVMRGQLVEVYDGEYIIEVDINDQHVWVYTRDGEVIMDSDCVTGKHGRHDTPTGIYTISQMSRNYTMHGTNDNGSSYASFCHNFMRITDGGIALHDASWRSEFGGDIYINNGSHGCINLPTQFANDLYNIVDKGTLVIVH